MNRQGFDPFAFSLTHASGEGSPTGQGLAEGSPKGEDFGR